MCKQLELAPESLQAQLAELNERSRMYTTQIWQLPLAYIGIVGLGVGQFDVSGGETIFLRMGLWYAAGVGIFVLWHLLSIADGVKRAVEHIQGVEWQLGLERTAKYIWYEGPLILMVGLTMLGCVIGAFIV